MNDPMLEKLLHSKNYQCVCPDAVRRIYAECCQKYKKPREPNGILQLTLQGIDTERNPLVQLHHHATQITDIGKIECMSSYSLHRRLSLRQFLLIERNRTKWLAAQSTFLCCGRAFHRWFSCRLRTLFGLSRRSGSRLSRHVMTLAQTVGSTYRWLVSSWLSGLYL